MFFTIEILRYHDNFLTGESTMKIAPYWNDATAEEQRLPLYTATIGGAAHQGAIHRPAGIPDYQLIYTASGSGLVHLRDGEVRVCMGQVFLLPPFAPHEYRADGDEWETYWITYSGAMARACFPFEADVRDGTYFPALHRRICAMNREKNWRRRTSALLYELLLSFREAPGANPDTGGGIEKNGTAAAVQYISEHYRETVELSSLAAVAGVSEGHLCRLFREYTHMRPIEYVNYLRVETAKSMLLENTALPISAVAKTVGFDSPGYFTYVFRKSTGKTPGEYRNAEADIPPFA